MLQEDDTSVTPLGSLGSTERHQAQVLTARPKLEHPRGELIRGAVRGRTGQDTMWGSARCRGGSQHLMQWVTQQ